MTNKELALNAMYSMGRADALDLLDRIPNMTDTEIIDEEAKIPQFQFKDYTTYPRGFAVHDGEQVYGLLQPYDARNYPESPKDLPALWGLKHTKNPAHAKPYVAPLGTSGLYMMDECCLEDGVYRCKSDNMAYSPSEYPEGWELINV